MTADCTTATTRRTNTAVTATPATAKVGCIATNAGHYTYHIATIKLDIDIPLSSKHLPHSPAARVDD